jgi:hypothetical protein
VGSTVTDESVGSKGCPFGLVGYVMLCYEATSVANGLHAL